MKTPVAFAFSLIFVLGQVAAADDLVRSNPPAQRSAPPPAKVNGKTAQPRNGVRQAPTRVGGARIGGQANLNVPRNYPAVARPIPHERLALNTQRSGENYPSQSFAPRHGRKVGAVTGGRQNTGISSPRANTNRQSYADALKRYRHERHDRNWWHRHCQTIVFVNTGYYYLDAGYWYPAYGYDPAYNSYDEDGPIYTYGDLLPDQVIVNVQLALREAGYYVGQITGSLGPATRAALANFQRDYGLVITGAVDEPTVQTLGLN